MNQRSRITLVLILVFCLSAIGFGQEKQVTQDKQLREEILAVYKSGGERGLLGFVKENKEKINTTFIENFAEAGYKAINGEWVKVCEVMTQVGEDRKLRAEILYKTGKYFGLIVDYKKAGHYFDKALPIFLELKDPIGQGSVYMSKGDIFLRTDQHSPALEMYDKALPLFEKAGNPLGQGNVNLRKGELYLKNGENATAHQMYDKAILFFEKAGDLIGQGYIFMRKGENYFDTGNNLKAAETYDKALILFEKSGEFVGQGNVYMAKAKYYARIGDNLKAIKLYDKALLLFEKAKFPLGQANTYLQKGAVLSIIGKVSSALEMYDKAMSTFEKLRYSLGQSQVYLCKGNIFFQIGNNTKALEMYDKAIPLLEKSGKHSTLGNVYSGKVDIYARIGENAKALEMYNKALPFFEEGGMVIGQGTMHLKKGAIYLSVGENSKALEMYEKAMPFFEKAKFPLGQGMVYSNKGAIYFLSGQKSKALEMYDKALFFLQKFGDPIELGNVYLKKGEIYSKDGDNSKALELYDKALPFLEKAEAPVGQGNVYLKKGTCYSAGGENVKALQMYDKALQLYKKSGIIESESNALHSKARALVKLGEKKKALALFARGIAYNEKIRTQTAFSKMKKNFMEKVYQQYQETVLFMLESAFYKKGFRYAESMRTRVFLDRMAEGWSRLDKGIPPGLKEKRDNFVTKLSLLSKEMHETPEEKEEKKLRKLKDSYHKIERELEDLLVKIRLNNPLYAQVRYPQPISVRALQKDVLNKGELLLRYFIAPEKTYAFLVSKKRFQVIAVNTAEKELQGMISAYLRALAEKDPTRIKRYGNNLYRELLKPLELEIKKSKEIFIIPDGQLATIPFEALIVDKEKSGRPVFLLEKHRIKYIQSASLLPILRKYYRRDGGTKNFTGFGDPVYDYEAFKSAKPAQAVPAVSPGQPEDEIKQVLRSRYSRLGGTFERLPASGEEVHAIAGLFKKYNHKTTVFTGVGANEENAKASQMKDFDYIHFACHGLLNDNFQSLVLSQLPKDKSKEDGYFTLNEIMNCDYHAKLIVLSACQTGSGKMERAEGVTGLTRAVMYAGTPAVVASLWNVDDRATKELMLHFYRNLLEKNLSKSEALRQAKLELMKHKKYRSPYFWSAFVMYGE